MKKEKGFTLIELLAVIVILAILMVIAVPKILNVIENSRKSAAESSIKLVKDAIKTQVTSGSIMGTNFTSDESGCYTFNFDDQTSGNAKELQLKNKENITGAIKYCNGKFFDDSLKFDGNSISKDDTNKKVICKRASKDTLHTEECKYKDNTYYCSGAGYTESGSKGTTTITYGNTTVTKNELKSGDAFDCDVNGDGMYDGETERFYYVSDYYNTSTKKFENDTAVLIYYDNVIGSEPNNGATCAYDESGKNYYGPRTAMEQLPTVSQWKNIRLKNDLRTIVAQDGTSSTRGGDLPTHFSYQGKSARLITTNEINQACGITIEQLKFNEKELNNCNYLMENTTYSSNKSTNNQSKSEGYWLENPHASYAEFSWRLNVYYTNANFRSAADKSVIGVRPVIEVPKSNIEY